VCIFGAVQKPTAEERFRKGWGKLHFRNDLEDEERGGTKLISKFQSDAMSCPTDEGEESQGSRSASGSNEGKRKVREKRKRNLRQQRKKHKGNEGNRFY